MGLRKRLEDAAKLVQRQDASGGKYEFESRVDRMSRRLKGVQGPYEERDDMREFVESRRGVEAYVIHPASVADISRGGEKRAQMPRCSQGSA